MGKGERKKERVVGVSKVTVSVVAPVQPQGSHQFWYLVSSVCQPSCKPLIHSLSTVARSQSGCLCSCLSHSLLQSHKGLLFLPCCPWQIGTAAVLCRCFQQRQWKFGCCLQSEQEGAQLAASYGQSLRTWFNFSLQIDLYWKCWV